MRFFAFTADESLREANYEELPVEVPILPERIQGEDISRLQSQAPPPLAEVPEHQ